MCSLIVSLRAAFSLVQSSTRLGVFSPTPATHTHQLLPNFNTLHLQKKQRSAWNLVEKNKERKKDRTLIRDAV